MMRKNRGLTLIEIIISIALLSMVLIITLTTFTSAFIWINQSGQRTKTIFSEQDNVEQMIEQRKGTSFFEMLLSFTGLASNKDINMRGGLLETDSLTTFVSKVPGVTECIINQDVKLFLENQDSHVFGQSPNKLNIQLKTINMPIGTRLKISLVDQEGNSLSSAIESYEDIISTVKNAYNEEEATTFLSLTLPNSSLSSQIKDGIYKISVVPTLEGKELLAAPFEKNYTIYPIKYVAVGNSGEIRNSGDGSKWYEFKKNANMLNSIVYGGSFDDRKYVAVGNNSQIVYSGDGVIWQNVTGMDSGININKVIFNEGAGNLYAAIGKKGTTGYILISNDGINWNQSIKSEGVVFTDIAWNNETENFYITGAGISFGILRENTPNSWEYFQPPVNLGFNSFDKVAVDSSKDTVISVANSNISSYYKDSEGVYNFSDESVTGISNIIDIIYIQSQKTFVLIDDENEFYKRVESEGNYSWEKANEIPEITGFNIRQILYPSNQLEALAQKNGNSYFLELIYDEESKTFKWNQVEIAKSLILNSMTGK